MSRGSQHAAVAPATILTVEEVGAIARCSVQTVRRAYRSGALTAYRRRGSRAILFERQDVLAWIHGQMVQATAPLTPLSTLPRTAVREAERGARAPKLGSQQRFDLSADGLRERRGATAHPPADGR